MFPASLWARTAGVKVGMRGIIVVCDDVNCGGITVQ